MGDGEVRDPFSITLTYDDYVTEVGLKPIIGSPKATTLGYSVAYTGTNNVGYWAFDDNGAGKLTSNGYTFAGESFLAYFPNSGITNFITSADTYFGFVLGGAPFGFTGDVLLTVTDSSNVPEPSTLLLLVLGLSGLLICRKKAT
jgi:hypothetical protein